MRPESFSSQLCVALARTTPAFQPTPRPARQGFARQLIDALARVTPAFQDGPANTQPRTDGPPAPQPAATQPASAAQQRPAPSAPPGPRYGGRFLTVAEVATIMRSSKLAVYRLVHSGELPAVRVGRALRVPEEAVHDYLRDSLRSVS